jgi:two-component system, cell cycle sensor histidine kinase and response regulator CckA
MRLLTDKHREGETGESVNLQTNGSVGERRRRTILLVEDELFVRQATCSLLERAGFNVLKAEYASEAMRIFHESPDIDLVMTDMVLPGANGQQLGEALRQCSPGVAVLITSGYNNLEYEVEDPETQTYFLAKPYSRRTLLAKIEEMLTPVVLVRAASQAG